MFPHSGVSNLNVSWETPTWTSVGAPEPACPWWRDSRPGFPWRRAGGCTAAAHSGRGGGISLPERRPAAPDTYSIWQAVQTETAASLTECAPLEWNMAKIWRSWSPPQLTQQCKPPLTWELSDLCVLVLKSTADTSTELSDRRHVSRQAVHFILHLFEIILHFPYGVWGETWPDGSTLHTCNNSKTTFQQWAGRFLTRSRYELVVVFIHQRLHVAVQRADLLHHAGLLVHQLSQGALPPQLHVDTEHTVVTVTLKNSTNKTQGQMTHYWENNSIEFQLSLLIINHQRWKLVESTFLIIDYGEVL